MSITFNSGFASNLNDAQGRKDDAQKTTALPFRDYLASTTATTPDKTSLVSSTILGQASDFAPDAVASGHDSDSNGFAQAMEQMLGMAQGTLNTGVSEIQHNSLENEAVATKQIATPFQDSLSALAAHSADKASFNHNLNDTQSRKDSEQKTTATLFRDYLASSAATTTDKTSLVSGTISGQATDFAPDAVASGHDSDNNGFVQAMEQMLGTAQGTLNTGVSEIQHNSLESEAVATKQMATPFQDSLSALAAHSAEKVNKLSAIVVNQTAEFDPFSVVRSGAVPENNAFVLALKRLFGLEGNLFPVPENASTTTVNTEPVVMETVQEKPVSVDLPPTIDHSPEPITGLSQLISDALEQSALTSANQEVMDTVLNKLSPVPENTSTTTVNAEPVVSETVQAKPVSVDLPPTIDHSPEPIIDLSQLISDALEQSVLTSANQEVMDTVLNKLG